MKLYYTLFSISFLLMNLSIKAQESKLIQLSKNKFQYEDHVGGLHSFKYVFMKDSANLIQDFRSFNANRRVENVIHSLGITTAVVPTAYGIYVLSNNSPNNGVDEIIGSFSILVGAGIYGLSKLIGWPIRIEKNKYKKLLITNANIEYRKVEKLRQEIVNIDKDKFVKDTIIIVKKESNEVTIENNQQLPDKDNTTNNQELDSSQGSDFIRLEEDSFRYGNKTGKLHEFEELFVRTSEEQATAFYQYDKYRRLQSNTLTIGLLTGGIAATYGALTASNDEKAKLGRTLLYSGLGVIATSTVISINHKGSKLRYKDALLNNATDNQKEIGTIELKPTQNGLGIVYTF